MRIALAVDGTRGDVQPMLVLGAALAARGHEVRVCAPPDFAAAAAAAGLAFHPVGVQVEDYLREKADMMLGHPARALPEMMRYSRECLVRQLDALPAATEGAELLVGAGIQVGGPTVAALRGVPYRYVAYCPVLFPSAEHPSMAVARQTLPRWANRASWRATRAFFNHVFRGALNERRAALGLPRVPDVLHYLATERPLLAAEEILAPLPADCPLAVRQVGALAAPEGEPLPAKLEAFLAQGPPPVYFGFGSMPDADPLATTRQILRAVEALGCRALVSQGWARLGGLPLPEGVMEIGAVSHPRLFPRVAAVVHHGGAGTTTAAARAGVPQVVVAHIADQYYWGRRVELLGLGPPALSRARLRAEALAAALAAVLDNELVAERAREIGERLRARPPLDPGFVLAP